MAKEKNNEQAYLRQRFLKTIERGWIYNNHSFVGVSCVYVMVCFDVDSKHRDIVYVGSTIDLNARYKSHKIPDKIQAMGCINLLYFLPMKSGFYDYERKLIKKLQPFFNKQHK